MSIFFPYSPSDVLDGFADIFSISYTGLSSFESTILTILANLYFFIFWFIIIYFAIKIFNRIWERLF